MPYRQYSIGRLLYSIYTLQFSRLDYNLFDAFVLMYMFLFVMYCRLHA